MPPSAAPPGQVAADPVVDQPLLVAQRVAHRDRAGAAVQEAEVGELALAAVDDFAAGTVEAVVEDDARRVDVADHAHVVAAAGGPFELAGALDVGDLDFEAFARRELARGAPCHVEGEVADPVPAAGLEAVAAVA